MMSWFFSRSLVGSKAPEVSGTHWFNQTSLPLPVQEKIKKGEPIDIHKDLAGYVVLVDFWDYSCINCINTMPYLKEWWQRYRHLKFLIIGVHTPEFEFAKDPEKVESAVLRFELNYPVVSDPEYATWQRYNNNVWPRELIVDATGVIRYDHKGEGDYQNKEHIVQNLLAKVHPDEKFGKAVLPVKETDAPGAVCYPTTPEIYLGYRRGESLNMGGLKNDQKESYLLPSTISSHKWALEGMWQSLSEDVLSVEGDVISSLHLTYEATEVFAVMRSVSGSAISVEVEQDGKPLLKEEAGEDVTLFEGRSFVSVEEDRLYKLVKNSTHGKHSLELIVPPGVSIHTFTFGSSCVEEK